MEREPRLPLSVSQQLLKTPCRRRRFRRQGAFHLRGRATRRSTVGRALRGRGLSSRSPPERRRVCRRGAGGRSGRLDHGTRPGRADTARSRALGRVAVGAGADRRPRDGFRGGYGVGSHDRTPVAAVRPAASSPKTPSPTRRRRSGHRAGRRAEARRQRRQQTGPAPVRPGPDGIHGAKADTRAAAAAAAPSARHRVCRSLDAGRRDGLGRRTGLRQDAGDRP